MPSLSVRPSWAVCATCSWLALFFTGCQTTTHAGSGAVAGAGLGGTMGAILGSHNGRAGSGALLGAVAGATIGGLAGEAEDAREERDAAIAQAQYERGQAAARQSITNLDLITMAQAGLSDQVIINSVQTRGGQFDLSPSAIIELKSRGVSETVILAIQRSSETGTSRSVAPVNSSPATIIAAPPPAVYIVRPTPRVGVYFGARPYGYRYRHHHHHW